MSAKQGIQSKRVQPAWNPPQNTGATKLRLYNSLTRQKEVFVPQDANRVLWYSCGPTVYDVSHMGHARSYISFDILRRVMRDYFNYNVFYCMNITDIDDKIIKRARQNYLFDRYEEGKDTTLERVVDDVREAMKPYLEKMEKETDVDKRAMLKRILDDVKRGLSKVEQKIGEGGDFRVYKKELIETSHDLLAEWLDEKKGSEVTENSIFYSLPSHWEEEFHKDMKALNVLPADVLTRVREYVPEIIDFVQNIIDNGYAYESSGSVYFDTTKFSKKKNHFYAKLVPEAFGDSKALQEGEGDLSVSEDRLCEKRSPNDFALWKASKPGEPAWDSHWGKGRPGWHIECSVMASCILGESLDIHTGGVDLKFPHHDNELAQAEARYENDHWVRYFLHSGHLTIQGCKMSKSLKNFITIKAALKKHTAQQLRLVFLLHSWKDTLDYSDNTMEAAIQYERHLNEFFLTVKDILRNVPDNNSLAFEKWKEIELSLNNSFFKAKEAIHEALCDSIDTRTALDNIRTLITATNIYISEVRAEKSLPNQMLLLNISLYVTKILHIFGVIVKDDSVGFSQVGTEEVNVEEKIMPFLTTIANFREQVRQISKENNAKEVLMLCDDLRDNVLPDLGVRLEDHEGQAPIIKLVGKERLLKEKEEKLLQEKLKYDEKERNMKEQKAAAAVKVEQKKIPPWELFKTPPDRYSKFDDQGIPTHDAQGKELSKTAIKKIRKIYDDQVIKYKKYLNSQGLSTENYGYRI